MSHTVKAPAFAGNKKIFQLSADDLLIEIGEETIEGNRILITGQANIFGLANQPVQLTSTSHGDKLVTQLEVNFPTLTLRQLAQYGLVPGNFTPQQLPETAFSNVKLIFDWDARTLQITGEGPQSALSFELPELSVINSKLEVNLHYTESGDMDIDQSGADILGTWQMGDGVAVVLRVPDSVSYWQMTLRPNTSCNLTNGLADLTALAGGANYQLASFLPVGLAAIGNFALTGTTIFFSTEKKRLTRIAITIASTQPWVIISHNLEVTDVKIQLAYDRLYTTTGDTFTTTFAGEVIGTAQILESPVIISVPLPPTRSNWFLEAYPNVTTPSLTDLVTKAAKLLSPGANLAPALPSSFSEVGSLTVTNVGIEFNPVTPATLNRIDLAFLSPTEWRIVKGYLAISGIYVRLSVLTPLLPSYEVLGSVDGVIEAVGIQVPVRIYKDSPGSNWAFLLRVNDVVFPSIYDLAELVGGEAFAQRLPESLQEIEGIRLTKLEVELDVTNSSLGWVDFSIHSPSMWEIISGYFAIGDVAISFNLDYTVSPVGIAGEISGIVQLAGTDVRLLASKASPAENWVLGGELEQGQTINLTKLIADLLGKLLPQSFSLPSSFPIIELVSASVSFDTVTESVAISGTSVATWNLGFAKAEGMAMAALSASLRTLPKADASSLRPYIFTASGEFSFMGIFGAANFTMTNTSGDTVIAVTVSNSAEAVKLPSIAKQLTTGAQTGTETWNTLLPTMPVSFADLGTLTLDALINLTQNLFVLYGRSSKYGSIAFVTKKLDATNWGYFVAAKLADGFTFASLLPELSSIDGVLTFKNGSACLAYSSFDAASVQTFASSIPQLTQALTVGGTAPVQQGVNFYAALNFAGATQGKLFGNVVTLLSGIENKPDLVVYGYIAKNAADSTNQSLKALFKATLGDFTVLKVLDFHGVTFQYSRDASTEVTLTGDLTLTLDKGTPSQQIYPFHGDLKVTQTRADFALTTQPAQSIVNPLGMTGVTIKDLRLIFSHVFETVTPQVSAETTVQLGGTANFGTTTQFDANLYFVNGSPALVEVSLTSTPPLGIIALLASSVAGVAYPTDYFDIKFPTGSAYYYKKTADPTGQFAQVKAANNQSIARSDQFNLQTTLGMFDRTVSLAVNVQSSGVTATGKMLESFDLDFIEFTDADFTGSPSLFLRVLQNEKAFGLRAGFKLFKERFATGELSIGKYSNAGTDEAQIRGRLAYAGNIDMFTGTALSFTYSKSEGFKITDWPFSFEALMDYAKLMNGFKKGGCSALVGMVFAKAVKTNFSVKPAFSSNATHYILTLKGTYSVALFDAAHPFLEVPMPDIPILIDRTQPFTLRSLPGRILQAIGDSAPQIVASILNDPAKFSAFIATVGLVNAAPGLLADLVCNGGKDAAEAAEAVEAAEAAQAAAEAAEAAAEAASTAAEAAAAAARAAAAAEAAAGAAAAVGGGAAAAAAAAAAAVAAAGAAAAAAAAAYGGGGGTKPPETPQLEKASIASFAYSGNQLVVSWQQVAHAAAFRVELLRGNDVVAFQTVGSNTLRTNFPVDKLTPGDYSVQVKANASNYKESVSDKATINVLNAVAVTLSVADEKLNANWDKVASQNYEVILFKDGVSVSTATTADNQKNFDPQGVGAYTVKVRPTGDLAHVAGPWSAASNAVTQPVAPRIVRAFKQGADKVSVICDSTVSYSIQLLKGGESFGPIAAGNQTSPALLDASHLAPGEYQVQIRANSTDARTLPSPWSVSRNSIYQLAAPVITALSYFKGEVTITLQGNVENANGFDYQLADPVTGNAVGGKNHAASPNNLKLTVDVQPGTYKALIKATRQEDDGFDSEWSLSTMTITLFERVTITSFTYANNNIAAAWSASPGATSYDFALSEDEVSPTQPVATISITPQAGQTTPPTSVSLPVTQVVKGKVYTAFVRPVANGQAGDWGRSNPVAFLDAPAGLGLRYVNEALTANWNGVEGALKYHLELLDEKGKTVVQPDPVAAQTLKNIAPIATLGLAAGKYTSRVKAEGATANYLSDWSAASNEVTKLDAPRVAFAATQGVDKIGVSGDYDGDRLDLQLVSGGKPLGAIVTSLRSQPSLLDGSQLAPGEYQVQVRVGSADDKTVPSEWVMARNTIYKFAAPVIASLAHSTDKAKLGTIIVTLQNTVAGADRYDVQFVNPVDGKPVGPVSSGRSNSIVELSTIGIPPGTYKVQTRARLANNDFAYGFDSAWNVSAMTITVFERLTINSIAYANETVAASWTPSTVATSYDFWLSEDSLSPTNPVVSASVIPQTGQTTPPASVSLSVATVTKGKSYTAYVRPVANAETGDWSAGMPVTITAPVTGQHSLQLNGDGAVIPLSNPLTFNDFTVEAWVKTPDGGSGATVFNCDRGFDLMVVDGAITFDIRADGAWKAYGQPSDGKWHHIAAVRFKETMQLYLDGQPLSTMNAGIARGTFTCSERITVGRLQPDNSSNSYVGMLDELRIWNVARQPQEIQQTMRRTLKPSEQPNLVLYYNFDNGTGTELTGHGVELNLLGNTRIVASDVPVTL